MNWQAISFDWNQVRAFLATAEEGLVQRRGARAEDDAADRRAPDRRVWRRRSA
jgi:hypothetical protein